ncbi:hypothetical protein WJX82_005513 [Trebouxia sp. C0006]
MSRKYLEGSGFCKTAGTFRREARKLLVSIVTPPSVKSLNTILNEFVQIKEDEIKRKQFAEANPLVNDLLAVIDRHKPPLPLPALASRHPSSSQHRKGAPRRRAEQSNKVPSPISRVTVLAPGIAAQGASANKWMDLPMTDDGLSCLMHDDAFQQRFAEDPNMAGLLEPLVLPAEAYQIPPHLQRMTFQQDRHQPDGPCCVGVAQQPAPLDLSHPVLGRPGQPQAPSHQLAFPASRLSLSANQAECAGYPATNWCDTAVQCFGSGSGNSEKVNRVPQRQQQSNPRQVLASLPANQMREVEPQGYLAAPNVVTQSAALDALPAKVPLQSGISFDPNAIEAFIKSLHERE